LPYCNWVRTVCNLLLNSLARVCEFSLNLAGYPYSGRHNN
jgi:hypothetical protein